MSIKDSINLTLCSFSSFPQFSLPSSFFCAMNLAPQLRRLNQQFSLFTLQQCNFASKKHKKVIKLSKGFRGRANRCYRTAIQRLEKSWQHAYRNRKIKRRNMRRLWIQRINAGSRMYGISYSRFIPMLQNADIQLNRKMLAELAMHEPFSFKSLIEVAKNPV